MKLTQEEVIKLKAWATVTGNLDNYVILKEDEKGRYVEYAFQDEAPHDNRCLSWYESFQPTALKRNGYDDKSIETRKKLLPAVGEIYRLYAFSCGHENNEGDEHCSPGHPCKKCLQSDGYAHDWTYKEPVKCACWTMDPIKPEDLKSLKVAIDDAAKFMEVYDELMKETKQ